jgi:hypothetical protein
VPPLPAKAAHPAAQTIYCCICTWFRVWTPPSTPAAESLADIASVAGGLRASLAPTAEYFNTLGLPEALVHWGHPGTRRKAGPYRAKRLGHD